MTRTETLIRNRLFLFYNYTTFAQNAETVKKYYSPQISVARSIEKLKEKEKKSKSVGAHIHKNETKRSTLAYRLMQTNESCITEFDAC